MQALQVLVAEVALVSVHALVGRRVGAVAPASHVRLVHVAGARADAGRHHAVDAVEREDAALNPATNNGVKKNTPSPAPFSFKNFKSFALQFASSVFLINVQSGGSFLQVWFGRHWTIRVVSDLHISERKPKVTR